MDTLKKELELLQRQKAASEQAALSSKHRQGSGGVWGWLAGTPGQTTDDDDAWDFFERDTEYNPVPDIVIARLQFIFSFLLSYFVFL